jgi:hypothetical protein
VEIFTKTTTTGLEVVLHKAYKERKEPIVLFFRSQLSGFGKVLKFSKK